MWEELPFQLASSLAIGICETYPQRLCSQQRKERLLFQPILCRLEPTFMLKMSSNQFFLPLFQKMILMDSLS